MKKWLFRLSAVHFILTAATGLILYFRPGGARPGVYSNGVKEWLVMIHNGEWISHVLLGTPFVSGIVVGSVIAVLLIKFSLGSLRKRSVSRSPATSVVRG